MKACGEKKSPIVFRQLPIGVLCFLKYDPRPFELPSVTAFEEENLFPLQPSMGQILQPFSSFPTSTCSVSQWQADFNNCWTIIWTDYCFHPHFLPTLNSSWDWVIHHYNESLASLHRVLASLSTVALSWQNSDLCYVHPSVNTESSSALMSASRRHVQTCVWSHSKLMTSNLKWALVLLRDTVTFPWTSPCPASHLLFSPLTSRTPPTPSSHSGGDPAFYSTEQAEDTRENIHMLLPFHLLFWTSGQTLCLSCSGEWTFLKPKDHASGKQN